MKKIATYAVLLLIVLPLLSSGQRLRNRWKSMRAEVHFGIGATNFMGDLGGANQIGTHAYKDFEFSQTRLALRAGYRYKLSSSIAINTSLSYGQVAGNDNLTTEFFRNYRNLSFKSDLYEIDTHLEFSIIKDQVGHRYRLKGVRGQRGFEMALYAFVGVGGFYFNPKAQYEGKWVALQPLGTEGQGLVPTREKYAKFQMAFPIGIGFKYTLDRRWGIGLEYGLRYTFTDYIDDVSKTYYDNNLLLAKDPVAAALADRSDHTYPYITSAGAQRGDPRYKDAYMFAIFSINYKLRTGRTSYPLF